MRYLAWLQATPKPPEGSRRAKTADQRPGVSRIDQMKKVGVKNPPMPPNPAPHVIRWLIEIGLTEAAGMGAAPLSWREINEWQKGTGVSLSAWETRLIRRLSVDYLAMSRKAEEETCPSPWKAPVTDQVRDMEITRLEMVLG